MATRIRRESQGAVAQRGNEQVRRRASGRGRPQSRWTEADRHVADRIARDRRDWDAERSGADAFPEVPDPKRWYLD
jgi:hypothetical protein